MKSIFKEAVGHSVIYGLGILLNRFVGFLMVPVYTHYLKPSEYGTIDMVVLTADLLATFFSMQMSGAILRFYYDKESNNDVSKVMGSGFVLSAAASSALLAVGWLLSPALAIVLLGGSESAGYFRIVFLTTAASGIVEAALIRYRAAKQPARFVAWTLVSTTLGLSLNIYLVVFRHLGIYGVLYSGVITQSIMAVMLTVVTWRSTGFGYDKALARRMFGYAFPLAFNGLGSFALQFGDRYVLRIFSGLTEIGIYGLAYKLALGLGSMLTGPFSTYWATKGFELHEDGEYGPVKDVFRYFMVVWCCAGTSLALFAVDIVKLIAAPEYARAGGMVPVLLLGMFCLAISQFVVQVLLNVKRTGLIARNRIIAAVTNVAANFALIPFLGGHGAAIATALTYLLSAVLNLVDSNRFVRVGYEWGKVIRMVAMSSAIVWAGGWGLPMVGVDHVAVRVALMLLWFPGLVVIGTLTREEAREAVALVGRQIASVRARLGGGRAEADTSASES
ncbi:MAG TPA: oligosaccharide flippase family protein [Candidatus Polarisedimenticolaceae bacterium]|nr:oligosaccharide flippase family protein [Candidatus Polarisedimenticolaceae bacterium]